MGPTPFFPPRRPTCLPPTHWLWSSSPLLQPHHTPSAFTVFLLCPFPERTPRRPATILVPSPSGHVPPSKRQLPPTHPFHARSTTNLAVSPACDPTVQHAWTATTKVRCTTPLNVPPSSPGTSPVQLIRTTSNAAEQSVWEPRSTPTCDPKHEQLSPPSPPAFQQIQNQMQQASQLQQPQAPQPQQYAQYQPYPTQPQQQPDLQQQYQQQYQQMMGTGMYSQQAPPPLPGQQNAPQQMQQIMMQQMQAPMPGQPPLPPLPSGKPPDVQSEYDKFMQDMASSMGGR